MHLKEENCKSEERKLKELEKNWKKDQPEKNMNSI